MSRLRDVKCASWLGALFCLLVAGPGVQAAIDGAPRDPTAAGAAIERPGAPAVLAAAVLSVDGLRGAQIVALREPQIVARRLPLDDGADLEAVSGPDGSTPRPWMAFFVTVAIVAWIVTRRVR